MLSSNGALMVPSWCRHGAGILCDLCQTVRPYNVPLTCHLIEHEHDIYRKFKIPSQRHSQLSGNVALRLSDRFTPDRG